MDKPFSFEQFARLNPCVKFIVDNYELLCLAHPDKVVMTMNSNKMLSDITKAPDAYVAKVFDSMIEAMSFTDAMDMYHVPYALIECDGSDITKSLVWSVGCKNPN